MCFMHEKIYMNALVHANKTYTLQHTAHNCTIQTLYVFLSRYVFFFTTSFLSPPPAYQALAKRPQCAYDDPRSEPSVPPPQGRPKHVGAHVPHRALQHLWKLPVVGALAHARAADEHEVLDVLGVAHGIGRREVAAHGVADEDKAVEVVGLAPGLEGVYEKVLGLFAAAGGKARPAREAGAEQVDGVHAKAAGEPRVVFEKEADTRAVARNGNQRGAAGAAMQRVHGVLWRGSDVCLHRLYGGRAMQGEQGTLCCHALDLGNCPPPEPVPPWSSHFCSGLLGCCCRRHQALQPSEHESASYGACGCDELRWCLDGRRASGVVTKDAQSC